MSSRKSIRTYYGFLMVKKLNGSICGRYPLTKKECTLGRDGECDIKILLENVSAHHCSIYYIDDKAYIRDKSLSGTTKVNGKKIGRNNFLLHHSDEIEICNRKFIWEYAKSYAGLNNSFIKKTETPIDHTPRLPDRSLNQINSQDIKHISLTPAKSITKTPSKILLSINKTPIVVASENMSKSSFDELKNNLQKQNTSTKSQSEHLLSRSYSMVPGRNIPLISDSKSSQRKSWVVTNTSDNLSSTGAHILNKLSTERLKRDSTPEFNSSYHYQDENVEFDSPEPVSPPTLSNDTNSVSHNINSSAVNNLSVDQSKSIIHHNNDDLQTCSLKNNIPDLEPEPNTSRRDTYSIDAGSIVFEQNSTPTPRRSILKCSKTAKPNRSRCRMVQFARLPKTDSRIKMSRSRFNTVPNFVVTNDEFNGADVSQDSRKDTKLDVEENYDDDLDGVQPLDISVSSLINSPILDISSVHKSSKRGSRGNKVMSLIGSFENRTHESPKHSIRASDLLSTNGSKVKDTTLDNDSEKNCNVLFDSVSSRRINLEDVFVAEDTLKNESYTSDHKTMPVLSSDESGSENEFNFASPLKMQPEVVSGQGTDLNKSNKKPVKENISSAEKSSIVSNICADNSSSALVHASPEIEFEDLNQEQNSISVLTQNSIDVESNHSNSQSNVSKLEEKSSIVVKDHFDIINSVSKHIDEESPSMIIQCMSKMLSTSFDELETTHSQHKENINESYVFIDKSDLPNAQSKETEAHVDSLNKSLMDAIEGQLDKMHDSNGSFNFSANESIFKNSSQETNIDKTLTPSIASEITDLGNPNLVINDNSKNSLDILQVTKFDNSVSKTKLSVQNNFRKNCTSNICESDVSQLTTEKSDKDLNSSKNSNLSSKPIQVNDKSINLSKTVTSKNCFVNDEEKNKVISNSHLEISNISERTRSMNKPKQTKEDVPPDAIESNKTRLSHNIDVRFSDNDNSNINKSVEGTMDTSFGKPQFESTPWNGSKYSKTSIATNQNETSHGDISTSVNKQNKTTRSNSSTLLEKSAQSDEITQIDITNSVDVPRNRSRSTTPIINPDVWSQMMKDFNESVKKASGAMNNSYIIKDSSKILFNQEPKSSKISINVTTEEGVCSNYTESENLMQKANKKMSIQCSMISSCSPNNTPKTSINLDQKKLSSHKSIKSKSSTENSRKSSRLQNLIEPNQDRRSTRSSIKSKAQTDITSMSPILKSLKSRGSKIDVSTNSAKIIDCVESPNQINAINIKNTAVSTKQSDPTTLENLSSCFSNENSQKKEKPLPCSPKNKKITSRKLDSKVSTSESKNDSNTDSSSNKSVRVTRNKKMTKKKYSSPKLSLTRRNLHTKIEKNELSYPNKKLKNVNIVSDSTSSDEDTEMGSSGSTNVMKTIKRELRKREQNVDAEELKPTSKNTKNKKKLTSSNKPPKNTSTSEKSSDKILTVKKSKDIQPIKTRFTRSNSTLNESSAPKLNKETKNSSPVKTKSVKAGKIKKTGSSKSSKKSHLKSLPSKPIVKNNKSDSSEYESLSETEEVPQKSQIVDSEPKTKKNYIKKKNVRIDNNPVLLPTRRNLREKNDTLNVSPQLSTRSRKRAADTSPLCQPNAKGPKRNISSKVVNAINSRVSNSPKESASAGPKKLTRNTSKYAVPQSSNNSFPETTKVNKKEKSVSKKRACNSDESSMDSAPSARKITRNAKVKENKTEVINSNTSTRSKSKVQNTETDDSKLSSKIRSNKNVKKPISPKPLKKSSTKQAVPKSNSPTPRVLRSQREKKK